MTTSVRGPVSGGGGQATALPSPVDGYVEEEYFFGGTARSRTSVESVPDARISDGRWTTLPGPDAPFESRLIVRRPDDAASASGVVLVEWLNVTAGTDGAPDWTFGRDEIVDSGHTWVGVSAQQVSISGGSALIDDAAALSGSASGGLVNTDPDRYGSLRHPGDAHSFDIFDQAVRVVRSGAVLGDTPPTHLIALGESQSAAFLATYANAIHLEAWNVDGYLLHSRHGTAPTVDGAALDHSIGARLVRIRTDLGVPVLQFVTETDLTLLRFAAARQPNADHIVTWEVAGTAHADRWLLGQALGGVDIEPADVLGCAGPANDGPHHQTYKAALSHLVRWVVDQRRPPVGSPIETLVDADGTATIERDPAGIALGGIRTPAVDVPRSAQSGDAHPGSEQLCALFGSSRMFDEAELAERYPSDESYMELFRTSLRRSVGSGFVLEREARAWEQREIAQLDQLADGDAR